MPLRRKASVVAETGGEPQQKVLSERLAQLIDTNPAVRDMALEVGIVDPQWLEQPSRHKPAIAPPLEMLRRFFERAADKHPSALSGAGVNALQLLSWDLFWNRAPLPSKDSVSTATVVFTDLEGFTRYTSTFGDDAALTLLAEHHRATAPIIRKWGGRVVKHIGDGQLIVFPGASAAVYAALEMVPTSPDPLRLRAGMHTGELVVTSDDLVGHVVNVAARVTGDARGGEVLVTAETLAAAGELPGVKPGRARKRVYKGIDERVEVVRVQRATA